MRHTPVPAVGVLVAATVLLGAGRVATQDASPTARPAVVACTVEPRPTDELLALWFGPMGVPVGTPGSTGSAVPEAALPQGEPADEATVAAVNAVAREFVACLEADQNTRAFALMTDDLVRLFVPTGTVEQTRGYLEYLEAQQAATPAPAVERIALPPVCDVRVLEQGRVGAILEVGEGTIFLFFERQGSRWLVDGYVEVGPEVQLGRDFAPAAPEGRVHKPVAGVALGLEGRQRPVPDACPLPPPAAGVRGLPGAEALRQGAPDG